MNSQITVSSFHQDKCAWEHAILSNTSNDPLEMWFNYISWYEQNRVNDMENKFNETLEKCLSTFQHSDNYKQDVRMIKLWTKFIDVQQNPTQLYQLLYQRNIGTQCSSFYIAWAHYYDSVNALKQAESVYNLGFQAKALPVEELQAAHRTFRMSISQRMLYEDNISKKRAASNLVDQRNNITSLNPPEKRQRVRSDDFYGFDDSAQRIVPSDTNGTQATTSGSYNYQNQASAIGNTNSNEYASSTSNSNQCDLNNSGYMIASSLNSVYDDTTNYGQVEEPAQPVQDNVEISGIKLPPDFARSSKNNHDKWTVPLCLDEPYDPNRKCFYPKSIVYPGDGTEYSLEEIKARKWEKKRYEIMWERNNRAKQELNQPHQQHQQTLAEHNHSHNHHQTHQHLNSQQQPAQQHQHVQQHQAQLLQHQMHQRPNNHQVDNQNFNYPDNYYYHNNHNQQASVEYHHNNITHQQHIVESSHQYVDQNQINQQHYSHNNYSQQQNQQSDQYQLPQVNYQNPYQPQQSEQPQYSNLQSFSQSNGTVNNTNVQYNQSVQSTNTIHTKSSNSLDDFEEQIEASTIRFYPNSSINKSKTITIKFKKEKPSTPAKVPSTSTIPRQHSSKKSKKNKAGIDSGFVPSSASNSTDSAAQQRYYQNPPNNYNIDRQISRNNMEDANLLLSIANIHSSSNDDSSQSYSYANYNNRAQPKVKNQRAQEPFINEDSFSNSDFQSSFNGIYYGGENSNSTPVKINRIINDSNTSTPNQNYKFLKNHHSQISNQNDDSMSSYTGEQNSIFSAESDEEVKQKRLEKALTTIATHLAKPVLDPFSTELCKAFLTKIDFPPKDKPEICHVINTTIPKLANTKAAMLGDSTYHIEKEVGRGAYGAVYRAVNAYTGDIVALKYQKPPNSWELYICSEVRKRISNQDVLPGFMGVSSSIIARNASVLVSEFSQYGSLLDINNSIRRATTKVMHESLVMHFTSQILNIVDHLHSCKIIHADIKPDNFLLMKIPISDSHVPTIRLIDFGCAIDMTLFKEGAQFKKVIQTDGFTCIEMQEGRPWSYQTDLFCVAGTVHVMLFGEYMQLIKKFGEWDIKQKLPRYLKKNVWSLFFSKLLNIKNADELPSLKDMKILIDDELYNMESELQKHIRTLSNILHKR